MENTANGRRRAAPRRKPKPPPEKRRPSHVVVVGRVRVRVWADELPGGIVEWKLESIYCLGSEPRPWESYTTDIPAREAPNLMRAVYKAHRWVCRRNGKSSVLSFLRSPTK